MEKENAYMQRTIDWKKMWLLYWKRIWLVVFLTAVAAVLGAGIYRVVEALTGEGQLYRANRDYYITFNFDEYEHSVDYYNAYTWDSILRDDPIVDEALAVLPDDYTKEEILNTITGEMISDYRLLTVRATHTDPARAEAIAEAYEKSMVLFGNKIDMLDEIVLWSEDACVPLEEDDRTDNAALLGAIAGVLLGLIIWSVYHILDDSFYLEKDFTERFAVPFLGVLTQKKSELCKQELETNLSYQLKEEQGYYLVFADKAVFTERKAEFNTEATDLLGEMKTLHKGIAGAISLQGEDLETLRSSNGAILMIPWGNKNGKIVEKMIPFLEKQDCKIAGAVLYDAEDAFLKSYYGIKNK